MSMPTQTSQELDKSTPNQVDEKAEEDDEDDGFKTSSLRLDYSFPRDEIDQQYVTSAG